MSDDDKSPFEQAIDQAMDAFVYAPIGLLFDGPDLFPKLAERGRNQVTVARMMGEMAVKMGQTEAEKRMARTQGPLREALTAFGVVPPEAAPSTVAEEPETAPVADRPTPEPVRPQAAAKRPAKKSTKNTAGKTANKTAKKTSGRTTSAQSAPAAPSASALGIPDYDSLSASQVVKRLDGMDSAELDAVRSYEAATRARKTILNRITQLQKA